MFKYIILCKVNIVMSLFYIKVYVYTLLYFFANCARLNNFVVSCPSCKTQTWWLVIHSDDGLTSSYMSLVCLAAGLNSGSSEYLSSSTLRRTNANVIASDLLIRFDPVRSDAKSGRVTGLHSPDNHKPLQPQSPPQNKINSQLGIRFVLGQAGFDTSHTTISK